MYCCGPTVYNHSHLGHAISYIRCDMVNRTLRTFGNLNIYFAMNITDIDDKIIAKSKETETAYLELSNKYYQSFLSDMNSLRVIPADAYLKVTDKVDVICDYIRQIYDKGFAYYSPETGDVNFDYEKFIQSFGITNDMNSARNLQTTKSKGKRSPKDFALWKISKENEPAWTMHLNTNSTIKGRPGWHVECSALSHYIFGNNLDIHFGGFDLIFPHHHCESCCSHAYQFEPSAKKPLYSSSKIWLHSGHLILRSEKMSKSLGNVILIRDFIQKYSVNVLRLLCIRTHYRSEIDFDERLLHEMSAYDEKLLELVTLIDLYIYKLSGSGGDLLAGAVTAPPIADMQQDGGAHEDHDQSACLSTLIDRVEHQIIAGILNDLDLNGGLEAILELGRRLPRLLALANPQSADASTLHCCIRLRLLLHRWLNATGLQYGALGSQQQQQSSSTANQTAFIEQLADFRHSMRQSALGTLGVLKELDKSAADAGQRESIARLREHAQQMLTRCDQARTFMEMYGVKLKDQASS